MKRVRITLEADESFVRLLQAKVEMAGLRRRDELDPAGVLAVACLAEMRGAHPEQVDEAITPMWRDNLRVIHEDRQVTVQPEEEERSHPRRARERA